MGQVERMCPFVTADTGDVNGQSNSHAIGKNKSRYKEGWEMGSVCAERKEEHRAKEEYRVSAGTLCLCPKNIEVDLERRVGL